MSRHGLICLTGALALACTPIRPLDPIDAGDGARDARTPIDAAPIDAPSIPIDAPPDAPCTAESADLCNGADDDCDPSTVDGSGDPMVGMPCDGPDSDLCPEGTYGACTAGVLACGDTTGDSFEMCSLFGGGPDEDCDGMTNEADAIDALTYYADSDGDGWGDDALTLRACTRAAGYVERGGDCDDTDRQINPGRGEECNARDDDCDAMIDDGNPCPDDCVTRYRGDHVYQLCNDSRPWATAVSRCTSFGYQLVILETPEENDFVTTEAAAAGLGGPVLASGTWIGLQRIGAAYQWVDGTPPTFFDWEAGEPNMSGDCVRFRRSGGWADSDCLNSMDVVCEAGP